MKKEASGSILIKYLMSWGKYVIDILRFHHVAILAKYILSRI